MLRALSPWMVSLNWSSTSRNTRVPNTASGCDFGSGSPRLHGQEVKVTLTSWPGQGHLGLLWAFMLRCQFCCRWERRGRTHILLDRCNLLSRRAWSVRKVRKQDRVWSLSLWGKPSELRGNSWSVLGLSMFCMGVKIKHTYVHVCLLY